MPYDEALAERIRAVLKHRRGITEKKMFGGLTFLLHGNMFCGVADRELMVRVGPDAYEQALARWHTREMDFTGRPLKGVRSAHSSGPGSSAACISRDRCRRSSRRRKEIRCPN